MNTKTKKHPTKMKTIPAPKAVAVKKEPVNHNKESLCHLVDDRVELIRQIFQTLKAKTIKSIAPDFLQECSAESLQEYCLDEILGISNKRLLSIIQATKCPTDTEDSDSDVENIEEHISLEEISSDSEDDKKKKKSKASAKGAAAATTTTTTTTTQDAAKPMSMLELLELQARARAIRSQLALEPVTKIELDSDNDSNPPSPKKTNNSKSDKSRKISTPATTSNPQPEVRPIRLKRNFKQRQNGDYDPSDDESAIKVVSNGAPPPTTDAPKSPAKEPSTQLPEPTTQLPEPTVADPSSLQSPEDNKETAGDVPKVGEPTETTRSKTRSPSPDIVPIISSPPTFCISSDDSDNEDQQFLQKIQKAGNYINMPARVTVNRLPVTEDELFLRKVQQQSEKSNSIFVSTSAESATGKPTVEPPQQPTQTEETVVVSEVEDGELTDDDVTPEMEDTTNQEAPAKEINDLNNDIITSPTPNEPIDFDANNPNTTKTSESSTSSSESSSDESSSSSDEDVVESTPTMATVKTEVLELNYRTDDIVDIDDDEDIIDLGKDEALDFDVDTKDAPNEDEDNPSDNWGNRWLRCKKVTKVMATARLASKVRSKIKKNKKQVAREAEEAAAAAAATPVADVPPIPVVFAADGGPAIEEGSVEQYAQIRAETSDQS